MPELPEVEIVTRGLTKELKGQRILKTDIRSPKLRFDIPKKLKKAGHKKEILSVERRAKYILLCFENEIIINHLGMTGNWRTESSSMGKKHDHVVFHLSNGKYLIYNDPRRFGYFDVTPSIKDHKFFAHLGPEPLDPKSFTPEYLYNKSRGSQAPIKNFIMNQKIVVGVGNIYASEALFRAKISPLRKASQISQKKYENLAKEIRTTLTEAIKQGGSTIKDFKNAGGSQGYFQMHFKVYGKKGEPCSICGHSIKNKALAGRSSFYCSSCQK